MIFESVADIKDVIGDAKNAAVIEWRRLAYFERYYRGDHRRPYMPDSATREFRELVHRSTTNLTRLVIHTLVQRLIVDGYRASPTDIENAEPWQWWQANGMDSRQKALYEECAKHGYAGVLVFPASFRQAEDERTEPMMVPVSPLEWSPVMEAWGDDWPLFAIRRDHFDSEAWWLLDGATLRKLRWTRGDVFHVDEEYEHELGVCPFVLYRNVFDLTRPPTGEIEPVLPIQDRLNQTVMDLLVAQTYSAAPQKYISGLIAEKGPDGKPIVDLAAFAKTVWVSGDPSTKFGQLPEANLSNIVRAIEQCLRVYGLLSQTPPHYLLGDLVNLSAEALLAADTSLAMKTKEKTALLGESHEAAIRLMAKAAGNRAQVDQASQVMWRDTEPRSIAQQVDALGKIATMLGVPLEALWEKIPGVTSTDLELWREMKRRAELRAAATVPPVEPVSAAGSRRAVAPVDSAVQQNQQAEANNARNTA